MTWPQCRCARVFPTSEPGVAKVSLSCALRNRALVTSSPPPPPLACFRTATLFGAITDDASLPIVKLVPTSNLRVWNLTTAAGVIDFEANSQRTVGVRVRGHLVCLASAIARGSDCVGIRSL